MAENRNTLVTKKFNVLALISLLIFILTIPLLFIPWYKLFLLRDDALSTTMIHVIGLAAIGLVMVVLGVISLVIAKKRTQTYFGTWMGIAGIALGAILLAYGIYVIVGYISFILSS